MTFWHALYQLLIGPLALLFEVLFSFAYRILKSPGLTIVFLSLAMNFLVLPLYRRADVLQAEQRDQAARMKPWVDHIKRTFRGDERFMILQTYYRQVGYKPTDALKGSVSLLLEVPFFIAAYRFLSGLSLLNGVSFGPIGDLGAPDQMIRIGGLAINLLPILMTLINIAAAAIYMKGFPLKNKLQMYGMALVFLVLLYGSPSGLVFYWTLNNVFSLCKNIFYKLKHPKRALFILFAAAGLCGLVFVLFVHPMETRRRQVMLIGVLLLLTLPLILDLLHEALRRRGTMKRMKAFSGLLSGEPDGRGFLFGCIFLAALTGLLIPSTIMHASPEEFINVYVYRNPLWYLVSAALLAAGTFVIWCGIFYRLAGPKGKRGMELGVWVLSVCAAVDYLFFGKSHGNLSEMLQYDVYNAPSHKEMLINLLVLAVLAVILYLIWRRKGQIVKIVALTMCLAAFGVAAYHTIGVGTQVADATERAKHESGLPEITLSKTGKNVIVLMMDRAISEYVPYVMEEKPELKEQFAGFTFYPNTLAYGGATFVGGPPIFGGYEYRPMDVCLRTEETISAKNDEALKVMPVLFSENGYRITISDPPLAGYKWTPDLSVFDEYTDFTVFNSIGKLDMNVLERAEAIHTFRDRNFFCYSIYRITPVILQSTLYNRGQYNAASDIDGSKGTKAVQNRTGRSTAEGISERFLRNYSVLVNLPLITQTVDDGVNTFLLMSNDLTHYGNILQEPEYEPAQVVDNTEYDRTHPTRTSWDGETITFATEDQVIHYHALMASMLQLGKWMDDLRERGVYDNTRIIIVSDHGHVLDLFPDTRFGEEDWEEIVRFSSLLLVKDFDSDTFIVDPQFMTQADVPTIACKGLIEDPVNPFTGNPITDAAKAEPVQYVRQTGPFDIVKNRKRKDYPGLWVRLEGHDIFDIGKWSVSEEERNGE